MSDFTYPEDPDAASLYYDVTSSRLSIQLDSINALDSKCVSLFSAGAAVIAVLVAVLALKQQRWTATLEVPLALAGLSTGAVGCLTIVAMRPRSWKEFPSTGDTWSVLTSRTSVARWDVSAALRDAWEANRQPFATKVRLLRYGQFSLAAETLCVVWALATIAR